jgi:hypothetical protein
VLTELEQTPSLPPHCRKLPLELPYLQFGIASSSLGSGRSLKASSIFDLLKATVLLM